VEGQVTSTNTRLDQRGHKTQLFSLKPLDENLGGKMIFRLFIVALACVSLIASSSPAFSQQFTVGPKQDLPTLLSSASNGDEIAQADIAAVSYLSLFIAALNNDKAFQEHVSLKPYKFPSESMIPTIQKGDYIFANLKYYKDRTPERGDIVVFEYPEDPSKDFMKRVIAIGGDEIYGKDKKIYLNNELLVEPYIVHLEKELLPAEANPRDNFGPILVPEGTVFVLGDNRDRSYDSRFWGAVKLGAIKGRPFYIYWSPSGERIGKEIK
jgi:signal peptidase I